MQQEEEVMLQTMPQPKQILPPEITRINEEWNDSTVVKKLLGHIQYLNQVIVTQASNMTEKKE